MKISTYPILFNIRYTPYKTKSNATEKEVEKHRKDRAFYDMTGKKNFYKYVTTEAKQMPDKALKFTMLDYFQKTAGVFDENGMLSAEQVEEMQRRVQSGKSIIWHGFISFDEEHSYKIERVESCIKLVKQTFGQFFKDNGFDRENLDLMCGLHMDRPNHLHIHFAFWEREPKHKRKSRYIYRAKGKIPMENINKMVERLNAYELDDDLKKRRTDVLTTMKDKETYSALYREDFLRYQVEKLAKELPKGKYGYACKEMAPYRERIDRLVEDLIKFVPKLREADKAFRKELDDKETMLKTIMGDKYKATEKKEMNLLENAPTMSNEWEYENVHTIERLRFDYRRRLGNVLLGQIRYIHENGYERNPNKRYKLNDKRLKTAKAISQRKITKSVSLFLSSLADLFTPEITGGRNRLKEIEQEIQEQQEQATATEEQNAKSRWTWSK